MKLLCTADLHLGRQSATLMPAEGVDGSSVGAWARIVDLAVAGRADAVLIAGDVFDHDGTYYSSRQPFAQGLRQLRDAGVPVLAVAGNHDWKSLRAFVQAFPDSGLRLLGAGSAWEVVELPNGLSVVGWSFSNASQMRWAGPFPRADVGLVHGDLTQTSIYHPLALDELRVSAMPWVLGHIHLPQSPAPTIRYPGSPQALDFGPGEAGTHGVCWLERRDGQWSFGETVPTSTVLYDTSDVVVDGEELEATVCDHMSKLCGPGVESVQWRGTARFTTPTAPVARLGEPKPAPNERDAWWVTRQAWQPPIDWEEMSHRPGAPRHLADWRLQLVGERPETSELSRFVQAQAEALLSFHARSFDRCSDGEDVHKLDLSAAVQVARTALLAAIESRATEQSK